MEEAKKNLCPTLAGGQRTILTLRLASHGHLPSL